MTTREKLTAAKKRFNLSMVIFMAMMFSGIYLHSFILGIGGFIGVMFACFSFGSHTRCPMCKSPLVTNPRSGTPLNFCPSYARSLDDEK